MIFQHCLHCEGGDTTAEVPCGGSSPSSGSPDDIKGGLLDTIAAHAALGGPAQTFLAARLAHRRGDADAARDLVTRCLRKQPGHKAFREFAVQIGAAPP